MKHFLEVDNEVIFLSNGWIWYQQNLFFTKIMNVEVREVLTKPKLH
jgi:hypothetical protein